MRSWLVPLLLVTLVGSGGCERERTRNSAGSSALDDEPPALPTTSNVYRFVGVESALKDARKAVVEERWNEALAAAQALLKQEPGHVEAGKIAVEAELEARSLAAYNRMKKALADRSTATIAESFRGIAEDSRYLAAARPEYERVREQWVAARENEARGFARAGRCRDAGRVARSANELFPEMRPRLDVAAGSCKAASGQDEAEPEARAPVASAPVASLDPRPQPAVVTPAPERPDAAVPAATPALPPVAAPAPAPVVVMTPPTPPPRTRPKLVPATELEKLRISGDSRPPLPAGAKMVAARDRVGKITIGATACLDTAGVPSSVDLIRRSAYDDANERIVAEIRRWRFKPYLVDGQPVPVCTALVFVYQMMD